MIIKLHNFFLVKYFYVILIAVLAISCSKFSEDDSGPQEPSEKDTNDLTIDPATTYQTIAGFGGANQMWGTQFPGVSDMKKAFGMEDTDLGFSIFRIRIASNPDEWPLIVDVAKEAQKYGAKILASPWSPPPSLKSNDSDIGGYLLPENYGAYKDHINSFIEFMSSNGVDIYAISIQNEPDWKATYESCDWTSTQMRDFIKDYGDSIQGAKLAAPESLNFSQSFTNFLLNDEGAANNLDIVAGHIYGGGLAPFPKAEEQGKEIWMTEYLLNQGATDQWSQLSDDVIWDESLAMLKTIHEAMMNNWNAYVWWYLKRYYSFLGDGTQGTTSGEILKRGYAFSHFSKFVRPGYVRVDAELDDPDIEVSAYHGDNRTVVILINPETSAVADVNLSISGLTPSSATIYVTTLNKDRSESEVQQNEDGQLLFNLSGKSVATVVIED